MPVNWWSVAGLICDIVGVLGVAFGPSRLFGAGLYTTPDELPDRGLVVGLSYVLIIAGFGLQLIGQLRQ